MAKETFYFSHDYEAMGDPKLGALVAEFGAAGYGIFWRLIEMMHSEDSHTISKKPYVLSAIAKQMSTSVEQISAVVEYATNTCELFLEDESCFWSDRVLRNIGKRKDISEKRSTAGKASAERRLQQVSTSVEQNPTKESKVKEKKVKESKEKIDTSSAKSEVDTKDFLDSYNKFLMYRTGVNEQFSVAGRTALKKIRAYFRPMVEKKHIGASPEIIEAETLKSFDWVLSNYDLWDGFYQKQLKLEQINSNLINIISSIKNGNKPNKGGSTKQRFDAPSVAREAIAILKTKFGEPGEATERSEEGRPDDDHSEGYFDAHEVLH